MTLRHDSWHHSEAPTVHFSLSLVWAPRLQTLCTASYLEVLWSVWCYTKTQTEIWGKRKTKAYENTEAAVSDTNGYKSWDFSTSKWVYFCFPQLNLEKKWNLISDKNFSRWQKAQSYLAFCPYWKLQLVRYLWDIVALFVPCSINPAMKSVQGVPRLLPLWTTG